MTTATLSRIGLDHNLGFKVVHPAGDLCFFRWNEAIGGWENIGPQSISRGVKWIESDVISFIEQVAPHGELMAFACCCHECHKKPEVRQAAIDFYNTTREAASHGFWPECVDKEHARIEAELKGVKA